jgi:hypothetical protein
MRRGDLLFIFGIGASVALAFGCLFAKADSGNWMPTANHYEAAMQGKNCAIIRLLEVRLKERVDETRKLLVFQKDALQKRRADLEDCGKTKGITPESDETVLAEVCPDAYDSWLEPSYRFHLLSQDLEETQTSLLHAKNHLRDGCSPLPKKAFEPDLGQITKVN